MNRRLFDGIPFAKIVAVLAASFGIGLGLCGVNIFLATHAFGRGDEKFGFPPITFLSLALMVLSLLGLVVSLIAWGLVSIVRGGSEPQRLFDDSDETKHDDHSENT